MTCHVNNCLYFVSFAGCCVCQQGWTVLQPPWNLSLLPPASLPPRQGMLSMETAELLLKATITDTAKCTCFNVVAPVGPRIHTCTNCCIHSQASQSQILFSWKSASHYCNLFLIKMSVHDSRLVYPTQLLHTELLMACLPCPQEVMSLISHSFHHFAFHFHPSPTMLKSPLMRPYVLEINFSLEAAGQPEIKSIWEWQGGGRACSHATAGWFIPQNGWRAEWLSRASWAHGKGHGMLGFPPNGCCPVDYPANPGLKPSIPTQRIRKEPSSGELPCSGNFLADFSATVALACSSSASSPTSLHPMTGFCPRVKQRPPSHHRHNVVEAKPTCECLFPSSITRHLIWAKLMPWPWEKAESKKSFKVDSTSVDVARGIIRVVLNELSCLQVAQSHVGT